MGDWNPGPVRMAPGELEPDVGEGKPYRRQVQWGSIRVGVVCVQRQQLVSLRTEDPNAPLHGFIVACARSPGAGIVQYQIVAGVGGLTWTWPNLAAGTYILYAQSLDVFGQMANPTPNDALQAWAGRTEAAPTLVLP